MRDGEKVTVKALTAMPGVDDGAVLHGVEWGPRLAALVGAGRYRVIESGDVDQAEGPAVAVGEPAAGVVAGEEEQPTGLAAADGDVDIARARPRRARAR